jgi:hypothetical protein
MPETTTQLLARHFFRRFFDNDLLSPEGDGHERVTLVLAAVALPGLILWVFLLLTYANPIASPGERLLRSLDDKFLYIAASMILVALVTLVEWDALALDARDLAVLGPLPIERRILVTAKLRALALFAGTFALAANALPAILFPPLVVGTLHVSLWRVAVMAAAHGFVTLAAAAFGFLAVLALRQTLRALLGARLFRRVSTIVPSAGVFALVTVLLLLPGLSSRIAPTVLARGGPAVYLSPPMWFLGLEETLGTGAILRAPGVNAAGPYDLWKTGVNQAAVGRYLGHLPALHRLAGLAVLALAVAALVALGGFLLEARRMGLAPPSVRVSRHRVRRRLSAVARRTIVRHPVSRAGFFFTLQALARNPAQRLYLAGYLAAAVAICAVTVAPVDVRHLLATGALSRRVLVVQMVLSFMVLAGVRFVFNVPAELRANWVFQTCWTGDLRRYLAGVRRAVAVAVLLPIFAALAPFHAALWGWPTAAVHFVAGWLAALVLAELLLLRFRKLPFTCSYLPGQGRLRALWPVYLFGFAVYTYSFVTVERLALETAAGSAAFVGVLAGVLAVMVAWRFWLFRQRPDVEFEELPDAIPQMQLW